MRLLSILTPVWSNERHRSGTATTWTYNSSPQSTALDGQTLEKPSLQPRLPSPLAVNLWGTFHLTRSTIPNTLSYKCDFSRTKHSAMQTNRDSFIIPCRMARVAAYPKVFHCTKMLLLVRRSIEMRVIYVAVPEQGTILVRYVCAICV